MYDRGSVGGTTATAIRHRTRQNGAWARSSAHHDSHFLVIMSYPSERPVRPQTAKIGFHADALPPPHPPSSLSSPCSNECYSYTSRHLPARQPVPTRAHTLIDGRTDERPGSQPALIDQWGHASGRQGLRCAGWRVDSITELWRASSPRLRDVVEAVRLQTSEHRQQNG